MPLKQRLRTFARTAISEDHRMVLSRLSLAAGLRPRVNKAARGAIPLPEGRQAAIVISADLELAWAWRMARVDNAIAFADQRAVQGRLNVGPILQLCDQYEIPITWATVGHLFLRSCARSDGNVHPDIPRVPYFANDLWAYTSGDWFDADPALAESADKDWANWYGPDLIEKILARPVAHEIGCHTFSHNVFSDELCPPAVALAELEQCQLLAREFGVQLRSFVFSGNLEGNLPALKRTGFEIYRVDDWYDLDMPRRDDFGLWRFNGGVCLDRPYARGRAKDHVSLLKRCVEVALKEGMICGLWFHPETDPRDIQEIFPPVFEYIARHRSELWVTTMGGLVEWLEKLEGRRSEVARAAGA
jgi:hypothetical protein